MRAKQLAYHGVGGKHNRGSNSSINVKISRALIWHSAVSIISGARLYSMAQHQHGSKKKSGALNESVCGA